jgi:hypothetical protein
MEKCEKRALNTIVNSPEQIVVLDTDCTVLSWNKYKNPNDSKMNAKLIKKWNITKSEKLYYHK